MWKKPTESEPSSQDTRPVEPAIESRAAPVSSPSPSPAPSRVASHSGTSVIGSSITLRGDISGEENLVVKGKIEGTLNLPNNDIQIDPEGRVKADMMAKKISVAGKVRGNLSGSERVVIQKSGEVEGNIIAPRVVLEDGCKFKGAVEMNADAGSAPKSAKTAASKEQAPAASKPAASAGLSRATGSA
jgi:cytoskeletal protein CcmA (bactofilin family)